MVDSWERIDMTDGRGVRSEPIEDFGVWIPRPTTLSGCSSNKSVVESVLDGTSVFEDTELDERHLKDISENIGRSVDALYGCTAGRIADSLTMPNKWLLCNSGIFCNSTKRMAETSLSIISIFTISHGRI